MKFQYFSRHNVTDNNSKNNFAEITQVKHIKY